MCLGEACAGVRVLNFQDQPSSSEKCIVRHLLHAHRLRDLSFAVVPPMRNEAEAAVEAHQ